MQITSEYTEMKEKVNENLLSDLLLGYLENDWLMMHVANTKLITRYEQGLIDADSLKTVYAYINLGE
jgi:hypothetical protein